MIEKSEVPDFAGIQYVDKANQIKIKKLATYRSMKEIPFYLLQGLAGACGTEINVSDIPVRFLGKELSQQDLQAVVSQKVEDLREYEIKEEVEEANPRDREQKILERCLHPESQTDYI